MRGCLQCYMWMGGSVIIIGHLKFWRTSSSSSSCASSLLSRPAVTFSLNIFERWKFFALSSELDKSGISHLYIPPSSMRALFSMSSCSNCLLSTWIRFFQSKGFNPERTPRSWPESPLGVHWKSRNCALWGKNSVWKRASWNGWLTSCFPRLVPLFCSQWKRIDDIVNMIDPTFDPCLTCIARKKISWGGVDYLCRKPPPATKTRYKGRRQVDLFSLANCFPSDII